MRVPNLFNKYASKSMQLYICYCPEVGSAKTATQLGVIDNFIQS